MAVVYALFVELVINRELKLKDLPDVFAESAMMMGTLFGSGTFLSSMAGSSN